MDLVLPEPVLDNSLWQTQLQQLAGAAHHGGHTLGLYRMQLESSVQIMVRSRQTSDGLCQWIERVSVALKAIDRKIYVVRNRKPGTCFYDVVLAHERKHQAIDDHIFAEYAPRIKRAIETALAQLEPSKPTPDSHKSEAQARLKTMVTTILKQAVQEMMDERTKRQTQLDTPAEYQRVGAACG